MDIYYMRYNKIVIGIDQSYERTGIGVIMDKNPKKVISIDFDGCKNNSEKRMYLSKKLGKIIDNCTKLSNNVTVIIERIRQFSKGFISFNYIKSTGALIGTIIDICYSKGIDVFSVDTRCWKAQVCGSTKKVKNNYGVPEEKWLSVKTCLNLGLGHQIRIEITNNRKKSGYYIGKDGNKYCLNHDVCDAVCIGLFGFVGEKDKLQNEV